MLGTAAGNLKDSDIRGFLRHITGVDHVADITVEKSQRRVILKQVLIRIFTDPAADNVPRSEGKLYA